MTVKIRNKQDGDQSDFMSPLHDVTQRLRRENEEREWCQVGQGRYQYRDTRSYTGKETTHEADFTLREIDGNKHDYVAI